MYFKTIALLEETTNCKEGMDGGTNVSCQLTVPDPDLEIRGAPVIQTLR